MFGHGLVQSTFYGTVSLIQAFLRVRLIPSVSIIPEVFHTHSQPHANLTSGTNDEDWEPPTTKKKGGGIPSFRNLGLLGSTVLHMFFCVQNFRLVAVYK